MASTSTRSAPTKSSSSSSSPPSSPPPSQTSTSWPVGRTHDRQHAHRDPQAGDGLRHATGELLTCPFCIGLWVATTLAFGVLLAPRATRVVAAMLCAVAGSDYLQLAYAMLQKAESK
ncbi:MAG: DUF1360 domain-containing protein [Acidimicrobiales bacterium]